MCWESQFDTSEVGKVDVHSSNDIRCVTTLQPVLVDLRRRASAEGCCPYS